MKIKRALISVWNKEGIIELAKSLVENNIEIISTGGTKKVIESNNIKVSSISDITGIDSVMDGRVKTLHPKIFGGILADRGNLSHLNDLENLKAHEIDLVVINFYPFIDEAVEKKLDFKQAIEYIDIGGPSMIRAAAKNYHSVLPLCKKEQYIKFTELINNNDGDIPLEFRQKAAAEVFSMTSSYESAICNFFNQSTMDLDENISIQLKKSNELRYGENPHQKAAFYLKSGESPAWNQHQGKELSYNNYADMETAFNIPLEFNNPACVIIKHANPCGFGLGENLKEAYLRAVSTDPVSYFGGIVGFNSEVNSDVANELLEPFLECIIAPSFSNNALDILKKKKNLRLVSVYQNDIKDTYSIKSVAGGYLLQLKDSQQGELKNLKIVTKNSPNEDQIGALELGWKLVRHVKSNAIVFADDKQLLGIGAGQMSRIDSVKIAIQKVTENGLNLKGAIMASDAFFPFFDSLELAAKSGIASIIQPGGSIKDEEVIEKANKLGISMVFTKIRHFLH